jgi:diguanylate cyclase (GGDEF)-like protein
MVIAAIAAAAGVLVLALAVVVARGSRDRSDRRFEVVLEQLDRHMGAISDSLQRVVERTADARAKGVADLELTVELDELLRRVATEAAARTEAEAAAVYVTGPGGMPAGATFGAAPQPDPLEASLARSAGPFRAVTINWTYQPGAEREAGPFASALVVPIVETGVETGTLAAYAREPGGFSAEQVRALEALAEEAAPAIASARRFAETQRAMTDVLTGLRNRAGYDAELQRAVARARETGLPLSLLILNRDDIMERAGGPPHDPRTDIALQELANLLVHMTRTSDVVCLRRDGQFGIVLPETTGDAARRFYGRLREEAARASFPLTRQMTFAAGLVEWRPNESSEAFDTRASAAVGQQRVDALELIATPAEHDRTGVSWTRRDFEERLGQEIARARRLGQPLALLILDFANATGGRYAPGSADRALADIGMRVGSGLLNGTVGSRVGEDELALILTGSTAVDAELLFAALQASLEEKPPGEFDWLAVSAGITELARGDDPASVFGRAEHALWRAKRAGRGTVVVAMAADEPRR